MKPIYINYKSTCAIALVLLCSAISSGAQPLSAESHARSQAFGGSEFYALSLVAQDLVSCGRLADAGAGSSNRLS